MRPFPSAALLLACSLSLGAQAALQTAGGPGQVAQNQAKKRLTGSIPEPTRFVVRMMPGTTQADLDALVHDWGTPCVDEIPAGQLFELLGPAGASQAANGQLLSALQNDPRTLFAEPLRPLRTPEGQACSTATVGVSGSPCTISFYDGNPTPEKYYEQPLTPIIDLGHAQSYLTGAHSIVAVIDTGVDSSHSLLAQRMYAPGFDFLNDQLGASDVPDGVDNDHDGLVDEATGHGTHVAGTIVLINPDALILPLRVLDSDGNGNSFDVARAIYYAVANGAEIINLSLGMTTYSAAVAAALDFAYQMEVEVFAAAGNTGQLGVNFPASYPTVLAVTAVDGDDIKAPWASFGPQVGVAAPGVDIYSAMPGEAYAWWSGTSMATAVATGVGSMLISIEGVSGDGAEEIVDHSSPIAWLNPGYGALLGSGRIDAGATVGEDSE